MKSFIKYLGALFMLALVAACGGSLNKPNIDPQVLSRMDATNSAYLFGSYGYEKKSASLFGNDIGYLSLLIEPADNPGEKPFYINMVKEDGSFLYSLKQGNYKVKELLLHSMNQNMTVSGMHNFFFTVTNGQIACLGRLTLLLTSDVLGNITISASSGTNTLPSDISDLGRESGKTGGFEFISLTNKIFVPKGLYFSSPSSM